MFGTGYSTNNRIRNIFIFLGQILVMDAGESIGLRIRAAARITAGVLIASLGSIITGLGGASGGDAVLAGAAVWIVSLFAGLVVALQGVIVLVEGVIDSIE
ncbi:hypothetical protein [Halosimplex marinum]|uniref:hypothetical protein n=1 Tax=Halosimplex marinum TaxID=3396620 RepID=UPI003F550075